MPGIIATTSTTLKQKIADFVEDVATLDVLTVTGDISLVAAPGTPGAPAGPTLNWDDLFANITSEMRVAQNNKLTVIAYTHVKFDLDSVYYVAANLTDEQKTLVDKHRLAVESAQKLRLEALKTAADIVKGFF
jgi:hypothetical protein